MGLSEAQLYKSAENEVISIKKQLYETFGEKRPNIIFIVVNKKINDRFMIDG